MRKTVAGVAAAAVVLLTPAMAAAATTIGSTDSPTGSCAGPGSGFQSARSDGVPVATPTAGVLTSWSYRAAPAGADATVNLRVFRATASPNQFTVVADAPTQAVPADGALHTFSVRIPVQAGDLIGLASAGNLPCRSDADAGFVGMGQSGALAPGQTGTFGATSGIKIDMAAAFEADADRDGFGDETQDACPQSAKTQSACPAPDTKAKGKHPVTSSRNGTVKIKFTSTVPGSSFTCAVDGKAAQPCTSPFKKRFSLGRHKVVITATSPFGITDPKPLKVKLRLRAA